jgi:hypothetical protein
MRTFPFRKRKPPTPPATGLPEALARIRAAQEAAGWVNPITDSHHKPADPTPVAEASALIGVDLADPRWESWHGGLHRQAEEGDWIDSGPDGPTRRPQPRRSAEQFRRDIDQALAAVRPVEPPVDTPRSVQSLVADIEAGLSPVTGQATIKPDIAYMSHGSNPGHETFADAMRARRDMVSTFADRFPDAGFVVVTDSTTWVDEQGRLMHRVRLDDGQINESVIDPDFWAPHRDGEEPRIPFISPMVDRMVRDMHISLPSDVHDGTTPAEPAWTFRGDSTHNEEAAGDQGPVFDMVARVSRAEHLRDTAAREIAIKHAAIATIRADFIWKLRQAEQRYQLLDDDATLRDNVIAAQGVILDEAKAALARQHERIADLEEKLTEQTERAEHNAGLYETADREVDALRRVITGRDALMTTLAGSTADALKLLTIHAQEAPRD